MEERRVLTLLGANRSCDVGMCIDWGYVHFVEDMKGYLQNTKQELFDFGPQSIPLNAMTC